MPYCAECGHEVSPAARRCPSCGAAREPDPSTAPAPERGVPWRALGVGCAVAVLVVGGIVAAIFVPNFTDALQKAKQKRTMSDLQELSEALESYREEHAGRVPEAASIDELAEALEPGYVGEMTRTDAWEHPLVYVCWSEGLPPGPDGACDTYRLISPGRDGELEQDDPAAYDVAPFERSEYDRDLVVGDGYFYRYPASSSP